MSWSKEGYLSREEAYRRLEATKSLAPKDPRVTVMEELFGPDAHPDAAEDLIQAMFNLSSKTARSEVLADHELLLQLGGKVTLVRDWILEHGRPPEGEELESLQPSSRVIIDDIHWFTVDEEGEPKYDMFVGPHELYAEVRDETGAVPKISLGFDNRYQLEVHFFRDQTNPEKRTNIYNSGVRHLGELVENEATIMLGVLDDFIGFHGILPPQK